MILDTLDRVGCQGTCRPRTPGARPHIRTRVLVASLFAAGLILPTAVLAQDAPAPPAPEPVEAAPVARIAEPDVGRENSVKFRRTPAFVESEGERVVARVNGVPMRMKDVFGQHLLAYLISGKHGKETLQAAIHRELLCQYALQLGLHRTLQYEETADATRVYEARLLVARLGPMYERQNKDLDKARRELRATDEEVEAYYKEHQGRYKRYSEDHARKVIKSMLSKRKFNAAHKQWLSKIMAEVPVTVNGKEVPHEVLTKSLYALYRESGRPPDQVGPNPLASYLTKVTGATDESADSYDKLMRAEVTVGSFTQELKDMMPPTEVMIPEPERPRISRNRLMFGSILIGSVKNYVMAEKAKQEGIGWVGMPSKPLKGRSKRQHLVDELWRHLGLHPPTSVEVTPEEVEAHIAAHPERYKQMIAHGSEAKARQMASKSIAHEKAKKKRRELTDRLAASATIEILDESFR